MGSGGGAELLMRMGMPDEYVEYQTKLTVQTRTAVITPFGVTEKSRRASGLPQGGTHSCALWNGFIDNYHGRDAAWDG